MKLPIPDALVRQIEEANAEWRVALDELHAEVQATNDLLRLILDRLSQP